MKRISFMAATLFAATSLCSAGDIITPTKTVFLYPKGQNVDEGIVENGTKVTLGPGESNGIVGENKVDERGHYSHIGDGAFINLYIPENCNGKMTIICPGGSYLYCAEVNEGQCVARWCNEHGIAAAVLIYRLPEGGHADVPLRDAQNALRYCRYHSSEWGVREIGIIGFSAGGHLAATASTMFTDDITRPDFSILVYPFIDLGTYQFSGAATRCTATLTNNDPVLMEKFSLHNRVSSNTPPTLMLLNSDDPLVCPSNSIGYYEALHRCNVSAEMHIFKEGGHGWGFRQPPYGKDKLSPAMRKTVSGIIECWLGL